MHELLAARIDELCAEAWSSRVQERGTVITYSPTVEVPHGVVPVAEVLARARAGAEAGCREAGFSLRDKPGTTIEYVAHVARVVLDETGLLPHASWGVGVANSEGLTALRDACAAQSLVLEPRSPRSRAAG